MGKLSIIICVATWITIAWPANLQAQTSIGLPPVVDYEGLRPLLEKPNSDTIYVVNFWATWCRPCLEEMPYLEQLHGTTVIGYPVHVTLVNLDFANQWESRLIPFLAKAQLKPKVIILHDLDTNRWIDLVDARWSGAIPATIIYRGTQRQFLGEAIEDFETLMQLIDNL